MKRMINDLTLYGLIAGAVLSMALVMWQIPAKKKAGNIAFNCTTSFRMTYNKPNFTARLNIFLQLQKDGTGSFDIDGKVNHEGKIYDTARAYSFRYQQQNDSVYHLTQLAVSKRNSENVSDTLMNHLFFSTTPQEGRFMRMTHMANSYVISNLYSPLFVCITN